MATVDLSKLRVRLPEELEHQLNHDRVRCLFDRRSPECNDLRAQYLNKPFPVDSFESDIGNPILKRKISNISQLTDKRP